MIRNERGGIISSMFTIPIIVALMAGFFFLGYYVGKYQSKTNKAEVIVPLPEIVSKNLPEQDFTFYKTLTEKGNKTVSIELKTKTENPKAEPENKEVDRVRKIELNKETKPEVKPKMPAAPRQAEPKQQISKSEPRLRYTLQVASYQEKEQADEDVKKLKQRGFAAFVQSTEIEGKGTWYRVRLGSFSSRTSAEKLQKELQAKADVAPLITLE